MLTRSLFTTTVFHNKYAFYDLVLATPKNSGQPIEALLMTKRELEKLRKRTKTTFEGNYTRDNRSAEEKIAKVFGTRIKGETRQSSSRITRGKPKTIAGVLVPARPDEPDNCCMSGCINCVWELFNEDVKEWNEKRKKAAQSLRKKGGRWPENFDAPVLMLAEENLPESLTKKKVDVKSTEEEAWGGVPVSIRVFAELERKMKEKSRRKEAKSEGISEGRVDNSEGRVDNSERRAENTAVEG